RPGAFSSTPISRVIAALHTSYKPCRPASRNGADDSLPRAPSGDEVKTVPAAGLEFMRGKRPRNCGVPVARTTPASSLSLPGDANLASSHRNPVISRFVVRERDDRSFLIACELFRERTGFKMKADDPIRFVHAVPSEVGNRTAAQRLGFLRGRGR